MGSDKVSMKLNLKSLSIEEACCDELMGLKDDDIKISMSSDGCNRQGIKFCFSIILTLPSGTQLPLYFCPYCGENLEYKLCTRDIYMSIK